MLSISFLDFFYNGHFSYLPENFSTSLIFIKFNAFVSLETVESVDLEDDNMYAKQCVGKYQIFR